MNLKFKAAMITLFVVLSIVLVVAIFVAMCLLFGEVSLIIIPAGVLVYAIYDEVHRRLRYKSSEY